MQSRAIKKGLKILSIFFLYMKGDWVFWDPNKKVFYVGNEEHKI